MEIVLLLGLALLLFGAKRLPEIGRSLGQGMREFKSSISNAGEPPVGELEPAAASRQHEAAIHERAPEK
jgi:sec-independent protein translocase protein TatA